MLCMIFVWFLGFACHLYNNCNFVHVWCSVFFEVSYVLLCNPTNMFTCVLYNVFHASRLANVDLWLIYAEKESYFKVFRIRFQVWKISILTHSRLLPDLWSCIHSPWKFEARLFYNCLHVNKWLSACRVFRHLF